MTVVRTNEEEGCTHTEQTAIVRVGKDAAWRARHNTCAAGASVQRQVKPPCLVDDGQALCNRQHSYTCFCNASCPDFGAFIP